MKMVAKQIKEEMVDRQLTLSVAESLTTGNIQALIGTVSGASNFFEGGITAYNIEQKVQQLNVNREHAAKVDCVSQRVANEMAKGVCLNFNSDIGIGTTGYAEPYADQNVAQPFAYFAIWRGDCRTKKGEIVSSGRIEAKDLSREDMQIHVAGRVVEHLLNYLHTVPDS